MTITLDQLQDYMDFSKYEVVQVYERDGKYLWKGMADNTGSLYDRLVQFCNKFPGVYKLIFKYHDTAPVKSVHTVWINCEKEEEVEEGPEIGGNRAPGAVGVDSLYEKVRNDLLREMRSEQKITSLQSQLDALKKENQEYVGASNKFASALEQLVVNLAGRGKMRAQMQGVESKDPPAPPQKRIETSIDYRRRLKEKGAKNPDENNTSAAADPDAKKYQARMETFFDIFRNLAGGDDDDMTRRLLVLAEKCRQYPDIYSFIDEKNLDDLAQLINNSINE